MTMDGQDCCIVMNAAGSSCDCSALSNPFGTFVEKAMIHVLGPALKEVSDAGNLNTQTLDCMAGTPVKDPAASVLDLALTTAAASTKYKFMTDKNLIYYPIVMDVESKNTSSSMNMGTWTMATGFTKSPSYEHKPIPRFFRIGTVPTKPWAYKKKDANGNDVMMDGLPVLEGYCVEMVEELSQRMFFDYELILPTDGESLSSYWPSVGMSYFPDMYFGTKDNGTGQWSGIIGDLVKGEIDIAVAGMTMTSEREEVVDFVAPYFDQSGISIIIRKPVRPRSLFKFMEVLRVEVSPYHAS